jgi:hypothetical protein
MNHYTGNGSTFGMGFYSLVGTMSKALVVGSALWFIVRTVATVLAAGA